MVRRKTGQPDALASLDGPAVLAGVLRVAGARPGSTATQSAKNGYAVRFADAMAEAFACGFSPLLVGIEASTKRLAAAVRGKKQLDVNFATPQLGLALGISLKSVHIREASGGTRYTHNMKRNEEELRIEAAGYHKRQPYAVMVGVLFLPFDSCTDARTSKTPSSFGSWVRHLRPYAGRLGPRDEEDRLERIYIALYQPDGSDLAFFDVRTPPPKNGLPHRKGALLGPSGRQSPPLRALTYGEFISEVHHVLLERNSAEFRWADGEEDPLEGEEVGN
jgi:hypothetical protein